MIILREVNLKSSQTVDGDLETQLDRYVATHVDPEVEGSRAHAPTSVLQASVLQYLHRFQWTQTGVRYQQSTHNCLKNEIMFKASLYRS